MSMTDSPHTPQKDNIPAVKTVSEQKRSLQLVWIIPIVAALIGGWLIVKTILDQGPTITVQFENAEGLEAGKTHIKYKNFDVGLVKSIELSSDRKHFIVTAQVVKEAKDFLVDGSHFWVVRPRLSGGQISGLSTLLSGSFIGMDPGKSGKLKRAFIGLEEPPSITADRKGKEFVLNAQTLGSLEVGSPVVYRGFSVGDIVSYKLNKDGKGVVVGVFINAPFDDLVTDDTRFWDTSGFDVTLDTNGVKLDTQSLVSILIGGLSFGTPPDSPSAKPAAEKSVFTLYHTQEKAMEARNAFTRELVLYFKESLRGLSIGAPVDFQGIVIGKVLAINVEVDEKTHSFQFPVTISIEPGLLSGRARPGATMPQPSEERNKRFMDNGVAHGMRAQLASGNLLTGQLFIEIGPVPGTPPAKMDWSQNPPVMPTVPSDLVLLKEKLNQIVVKVANMPLDEVVVQARETLITLDDTLKTFNKLVQHVDSDLTPEAVSALASAKRAADNMEKLLASDAPVQQDIRDALQELTRASESIRVLTDYLQTHPEAVISGKKKEE
jgi:paraquat-inducible protein B